jgi:predicted regulator of Ras-like GTPase activity (Roadblock/LC7/MglB family)
MDVSAELAELLEISSQIEAAVLFRPGGELVGSTVPDEGRTAKLVRTARDLVAAAEEARDEGEPLTQIEVSTREGSVFVVRGADVSIAAATATEPTVGLVFYDLKSCLRRAEGPAPERRRAAKDAGGTP